MYRTSENEPTEKKKTVVDIKEGTDFNDPPPEELSPNLTRVLENQRKLKKLVAGEIKFSQPMLEQAGNAVIFPHTINVIQGQAGKHKSRLAENVCAALLKKVDCRNELLGFKRTNLLTQHTVVYVDTERNLSEQLPYSLQSIQLKAGHTKEHDLHNFQYITLLDISRKERFNTLKEYLDHLRKSDTRSLFIVLDVSTDCIEDFNKVDKSMDLIDLMNMAINETDVTFLCIIHENPGSEKGRGHFGTELMNKASTVLQVAFEKDANQHDTELIRGRYLKCRSTVAHKPFYFKYCNDIKGLVLASDADIKMAMDSRQRKAGADSITEHIEMYLGDGGVMIRTDLLDKLCTDFDTSQRTMEARLKELYDSEAEFRDNDGRIYILYKDKRDHQIFYSFKSVDAL